MDFLMIITLPQVFHQRTCSNCQIASEENVDVGRVAEQFIV